MTEQELRALDGPALTVEAFRQGLAPKDVQVDEEDATVYRIPLHFHEWQGYFEWDFWEPHINLAQADAVLRKLREQGWGSQQCWSPGHPQLAPGYVEVSNATHQFQAHFTTPSQEAHALLLCAVLAASAGDPSPCTADTETRSMLQGGQ